LPYEPPSLEQCIERARLNFQAEFPGSNAWIWPNNVYVTAKVFGTLIWACFRFLAYILRQVLVTTCDRDFLDRHGAEYGVVRLPATAASGSINVTGASGILIPLGEIFTRGDGVTFANVADHTIDASSTGTITVEATATGPQSNTISGSPFTTTVAGVTTAISLDLTGGSNVEPDDLYRQRILDRKRDPPSVGTPADYVRWAKQVPGVTRVFVKRVYAGPGSVGVFFMMDGTYSSGIPLAGDVATVKAHLETMAPSESDIVVVAPIAKPIDITIQTLEPFSAAVRNAVVNEIQAAFQRWATSGTGAGETFSKSWIGEAASMATGERRHVISTPVADVPYGLGEVPVVGNIVFA
jgi:uncharacterized phage protein gp47/JayE